MCAMPWRIFAFALGGMLLGWACGTMIAAYIRRPSQMLLGGLILSMFFIVYSSTFADIGVRYLRYLST